MKNKLIYCFLLPFLFSSCDNFSENLITSSSSFYENSLSYQIGSSSFSDTEVIKISTIDDLKNINFNLSGNYKLVDNITLSDTWEGIGSYTNPFSGTFDGNGYKLISLDTEFVITDELESAIKEGTTVNFEYNAYAGIFKYSTGIIKNTNVEGSFNYEVNSLPDLSNLNIDYSAYTLKYKIYGGGLIGYNDGTITNSHINASLKGTDSITKIDTIYHRAGLLCGKSTKNIDSSSAIGEISFKAGYSKNARIGGLIGSTGSSITNQCFSNTKLKVTTSNANLYVGGFIGYMEGGNVINSYSLSSSIKGLGNVQTEGNIRLGGLIGCIDTLDKEVSISNSYSNTDVLSGTGKKSSVAGLIGNIELKESILINNTFTIFNSLSVQAKKIENCFGAFIVGSIIEDAAKTGTISINNNYYIKNNVESNVSLITSYGNQINYDELIDLLNWDFDNIWNSDFTLKGGE